MMMKDITLGGSQVELCSCAETFVTATYPKSSQDQARKGSDAVTYGYVLLFLVRLYFL